MGGFGGSDIYKKDVTIITYKTDLLLPQEKFERN